tara:strand:+ start:833 stop:2185 length:1353 start_codon:yes stop_codon:yes gene_type:complete
MQLLKTVVKFYLQKFYLIKFYFSKIFFTHLSFEDYFDLGNNFKKKNPFNSKIKKIRNNTNSDKFFIFGPSLVRSFSISDKFIPIFVDHALRSTFLTKKLSQATFSKYYKALKQLNKGSNVIFCMSMQDPDIHLRNEFKTSKKNITKLLEFSSKENILLAKYAKEKLKLKVYYLLGWPHVKKKTSNLVEKYNSLLKKECEKNFIEILDISKFIKDKSGNMKSNLCSIPNDVHPKTTITKFLFKETFKKKFTNKNYYNWNSLLNLTFSNNFNFRVWPIPYIGETNSSFNRLVQYCNIKEKIANIITGFAIENDVSNYISFDSSEMNLELYLGKDLFEDIKIYYSIEKKLKMAAEISNLVNRKEINTYNFSKINILKVKKNIIFFNLFEIKKKHYIKLIKNNISKKNCVFIFGNRKDIDSLKKQKNLKEIQSISFDNRFLSKNLKKSKLCLVQ